MTSVVIIILIIFSDIYKIESLLCEFTHTLVADRALERGDLAVECKLR